MGEAFKLASVNGDLEDMSAKDYIKNVLPKYLKIAKTCDTAQDGFAGSFYSGINARSAAVLPVPGVKINKSLY